MDTAKAQISKRKTQSLKGKKVLITAGPAWVAIDKVRVISNRATGSTGKILAEKLAERGAKVSLLINSENPGCHNKRVKILPFRFFDQLKRNIINELSSGKYNVIIHSAAVSDYEPVKVFAGKIDSDKKLLRLDLKPTPKIINRIKKIDSSLFLVGFKHEPGYQKGPLIRQAKRLIDNTGADIVVANSSGKKGYQAYILSRDKIYYGPIRNKTKMVEYLINVINSSPALKKTLQKSN